MLRRALLAAPLLALGVAEAVAQAPAPPANAASPANAADIRRAETYLNGITTLRARFVQIAGNGASAQGTAVIVRPNRMRFDYDPPEPLLLIAQGGQFLHYDKELRQPSVVATSATPLGVLLRPQVQLSGDVTVTGVTRDREFLRITIFRTAAPNEGRLTLVFAQEPFELRQWSVLDPQGRTTRVSLSQIETGIRIPASAFEFNTPGFFDTVR